MPFEFDGYRFLPEFLSAEEISFLITDLEKITDPARAGTRHIEQKSRAVKDLIGSAKLRSCVLDFLPDGIFVRCIYFNKTPENNWSVGWHQDKTIAVDDKHDITGWGPWTVKDGQIHVQPPLDVLNRMMTIRIHLDDTDQENGCLRIIPGSHQQGLLSASEAVEIARQSVSVECMAKAGDAFLMKPHILHSSAKSKTNSKRRIIHLEFCDYQLPSGLEWSS